MSSESELEDSSDERETPLHQLFASMPESFPSMSERFNNRPIFLGYSRSEISLVPCDQVDDPDEDGNTLLMLALKSKELSDNDKTREFVITALLDKGADIHKSNNEGYTGAMLFISDITNIRIDKVKRIMQNEKPNQGVCPIKYRPVDLLEQIIIQTSERRMQKDSDHWWYRFVSKLGLDFDEKNDKGLTPLLIAVDYWHFPVIEVLLRCSNADSCVRYPDGEWLLSRLMTRCLDDKNFYNVRHLPKLFLELYNCPAFDICEQSSVDSSPVVDILHTGGLVEQILKELGMRYYIPEYKIQSIFDLNFIIHILNSLVCRYECPVEYKTHLARYLLSIAFKPNDTDQFLLCDPEEEEEEEFLLSMVSGSKTLVEVFVKTGAMPVFNYISETNIRRLFSYHFDERNRVDILISDNSFSPFLLSFFLLDVDMTTLFIKANFLTSLDLHPSTLMKSKIKELIDNHPELIEIYRDFYWQPHSLLRLSFVQVSMCVGFDSDREERVSLTGLCPSLQRSLMFG